MTRSDHISKEIRETLHYATKFQGNIFVIHIEERLCQCSAFIGLVADIALLRRAGVNVVITVGIYDEHLVDFAKNSKHFISDSSIGILQNRAFEAANRLLAIFRGESLDAVVGNWAKARAMPIEQGVDQGRAGQFEAITDGLDCSSLNAVTPVIPCIGWSATGKSYWIEPSNFAANVAKRLRADKLCIICDHSLASMDGHSIPSELSPDDALRWAANRLLPERARTIFEASTAAIQAGVPRVHILNGERSGVLLGDLFSNRGAGIMIHSNVYQRIRAMRQSDISQFMRILTSEHTQQHMAKRGYDDLIAMIDRYSVHETDGVVHGGAALMPIDSDTAEIASIAVSREYTQSGIGSALVEYIVARARKEGYRCLLALTTGSVDWFERFDFRLIDKTSLPPDRMARYDDSRNPRILSKTL